MVGFTGDMLKLTALLHNRGLRHSIGVVMLAIRSRIMRRCDKAIERSMNLKFTVTDVSLKSLRITSPNKRHGFSYVPCNWIAVRMLLDNLNADFRRFSFVDFGSGEGRSLVIASAYPFAQVIGVEFAQELHDAAVQNVHRARPELAHHGKVRSVHMDAALFEIPSGDCVLYFYNPFDEVVFQSVLANIERAYRESKSKFYVVFHQTRAALENDNTRNAELLKAARFLKPCPIRFPSLWHRFLLASQDMYLFESTDAELTPSDVTGGTHSGEFQPALANS